MKILEIIYSLSSGGAERFVVDLSNEMSKTNDVTLLAIKDDGVDTENRCFYKSELANSVKYDCLHLRDGLTPTMWWKIWKYIHDNIPDVVHYHGCGMPYWMMIPMFFTSSKVVFVQTIHNDIHNGYDSGIYKWLVKLFGNRRKVRFVAISQTNFEELMKVYPKILGKCIVNGRAPMVPTAQYDEVRAEIDSFRASLDTKIFLHVARCHEDKNQRRLITAFNRLAQNHNAELLIIGRGFDCVLGKNLQEMANEHIHFLGTKKNISDYQLCADAFCLSSDFEGMPITLVEALMSGTPAISTPVCGSVDAIVDGHNGVLARDFTDEAYYDALLSMFKNQSIYKANAVAEKDSNHYTIQKCAERYLDFFKY